MEGCESKLNLIAKLIDSNIKNEHFREFQRLLYEDFVEFSNEDNFLANETKIFLKLQEMEKELGVVSAFAKLYTKRVLAVGGGFSSGKSEFISSFFKSDLKLPIGVVPTTAIPSYVVDDEKSQVLAISFKGSAVEVGREFYSKLSHEFISSFGFNLKEIMPYMIVATKMMYENICFVDTPGYNPPKKSGSFTQSDLESAREFLQNSNAFFWLIGADSSGTISSSDLEFLEELDLSKKQLFVILNKSSLKPLDEIKEMVEDIAFTLEDNEIDFRGISAYDSKDKKEFYYEKISLFEFLDENNAPSLKHQEIVDRLKKIYLTYKYAILKNDEENRAIYNYLKSISLDMFEDGFDESTAFEKIEKLKDNFSSKKSKRLLKKLDDLFEKLKSCVDAIFEKRSNFSFDELKIDDIELDFLPSKKEDGFEECEDDNHLMEDLNSSLDSLKNLLKD